MLSGRPLHEVVVTIKKDRTKRKVIAGKKVLMSTEGLKERCAGVVYSRNVTPSTTCETRASFIFVLGMQYRHVTTATLISYFSYSSG